MENLFLMEWLSIELIVWNFFLVHNRAFLEGDISSCASKEFFFFIKKFSFPKTII